jgi:glucokinase
VLFQSADAGDEVACLILDHCISVWSALTVSLIHAYDPKVIVFGGGVMRRQEAILPRIREHVDRHAWAERGSVKIAASTLGSSAALLGALPLLRGEA